MPRVRLSGIAADWARAEYARYHKLHPGSGDWIGFGFVSQARFDEVADKVLWEKVENAGLVQAIRESWDHTQNGDFWCYPSEENTICVMLSLF